MKPEDPIPEAWLAVLATWPALREHPAWQTHPQLAEYDRRPRVIGWRYGKPIFEEPKPPASA